MCGCVPTGDPVRATLHRGGAVNRSIGQWSDRVLAVRIVVNSASGDESGYASRRYYRASDSISSKAVYSLREAAGIELKI